MTSARSRISFTLSAELRNQIYELALDLNKDMTLPTKSQCKHDTWSYAIPALLATNKQVRIEASPIFWSNKKLCLQARHGQDLLPDLLPTDGTAIDLTKDLFDEYEIDEVTRRKLRGIGPAQLSMVEEVEVKIKHQMRRGLDFKHEEVMSDLKLAQFGIKPGAVTLLAQREHMWQ